MDLKIYSVEKTHNFWLYSWLESLDFRQNYLCDSISGLLLRCWTPTIAGTETGEEEDSCGGQLKDGGQSGESPVTASNIWKIGRRWSDKIVQRGHNSDSIPEDTFLQVK